MLAPDGSEVLGDNATTSDGSVATAAVLAGFTFAGPLNALSVICVYHEVLAEFPL
jgi:hypothetical protein